MNGHKFSAVIVAGGISNRYGDKNKLAEEYFSKTVLQHSVDVFIGIADEIIVVGDYDIAGVKCVKGGDTRFQSVKNGLREVSPDCEVVAIHDAARPFVSRRLVKALFIHASTTKHSAVPYVPSTDAAWTFLETPRRPLFDSGVICVQTPQCFNYKMLTQAIETAARENYPDESMLFYEKYGQVKFKRGEPSNRKITYRGDVPDYKVGTGFDVHPFEDGSGVILGGVTIPFDKKLKGHSDADALCHAVCDAVLSASDNKDIGHQFPDTDDRYRNADSIELLKQCAALARKNFYEVFNVSAVVICEQPKIAPYVDVISAKLADALEIPVSCVNITATTTERLGALGNGDGIAAQANALLKRIEWH
ncbi:MAG: 2-C-methyl-D-erythritol 2,4-cyclodiphosphate synthase [Corallococcus sp.]|nr:2-C-methyl-D-erythritol 2,4-cyclodiphosphate synthase [Bacillota bacterium]MCM1533761.1 2-C-methyl-D-erythritol 2,4-cyclodiphosphate synthase [Corallococcus sp.]